MLQHDTFFKAINQNNSKKAGINFYFLFKGAEVPKQLSGRPNTATPIKAPPGRMLPWLICTPKCCHQSTAWAHPHLAVPWQPGLSPGASCPLASLPPGAPSSNSSPNNCWGYRGGTACPSSLLAFCCLSSMLELPWLVFHCSP